ncbi:MAG: CoA transferase [Dehalococcoidales bacterium]|nr:MAG: CoA transferase [Dehalococcoidales bacterium]
MNDKPVLHNIRILDFSWVLAGPYATRILADFGAEVIKVQPLIPEADDIFARGYYNTWNHNKRGITLNMNEAQGVALARKLVGISDAVVENFAPRVMANWGLDYDNIRQIKPDIIMLSMSVMGNSGPWRDYAGFGPGVQAFSGMTHLSSYPGEPPSGLGHSYADHIAGLYAALALLSALEYRHNTGEGQYIDVSQVEAMVSLLGDAFLEYGLTGKPPEPAGNRSANAAPHGVYRCRGKDRWCAIAVFSDRQWLNFKKAIGNPAWAEDGKWATVPGRLENTEELDMMVEEWTSQHTAEEVMALLQAQGVAAGVVQNAGDIASDQQLRARGFFIELEHPELGKTVSDGNPIRLSRTPASYHRAAPTAGQDNDYVYGELLDISESELTELRRQGVI